MYLHLGQAAMVPEREIIGFFDLDNTTQSHLTRKFLERCEKEGRLESLTDDIPKTFALCGKRGDAKIYFSQFSAATLRGRVENGSYE